MKRSFDGNRLLPHLFEFAGRANSIGSTYAKKFICIFKYNTQRHNQIKNQINSALNNKNSHTIRDRILMANDGVIVLIANIDANTKELLNNVSVTTRGFILVNENEELINKISKCASDSIKKNIKITKNNYNDLKNLMINEVSPFIINETGRKPLILPVFLEINKQL